jgi:hypothetical protein
MSLSKKLKRALWAFLGGGNRRGEGRNHLWRKRIVEASTFLKDSRFAAQREVRIVFYPRQPMQSSTFVVRVPRADQLSRKSFAKRRAALRAPVKLYVGADASRACSGRLSARRSVREGAQTDGSLGRLLRDAEGWQGRGVQAIVGGPYSAKRVIGGSFTVRGAIWREEKLP